MAIPTDEPAVRQMLLEARKASADRQMSVLHDAATTRYRQPGDPPVEETVLLDKAEALARTRLLLKTQGTWSYDVPEVTLIKRIEAKLKADLEELQERREAAKQQPR